MASKTARLRAALKAKNWKRRARVAGLMKKRKSGGRLKRPHKRTLDHNVAR